MTEPNYHEHAEVWQRLVEDADMQRTEQMRRAVVWGIVYEKAWTQYEYDSIRSEYPQGTTVEEMAAAQRRHFIELSKYASKEADRVCRYLEETQDQKEPTT